MILIFKKMTIDELKVQLDQLKSQLENATLNQSLNQTVSLDISSISAIENSTSIKPPIFKGINFYS